MVFVVVAGVETLRPVPVNKGCAYPGEDGDVYVNADPLKESGDVSVSGVAVPSVSICVEWEYAGGFGRSTNEGRDIVDDAGEVEVDVVDVGDVVEVGDVVDASVYVL